MNAHHTSVCPLWYIFVFPYISTGNKQQNCKKHMWTPFQAYSLQEQEMLNEKLCWYVNLTSMVFCGWAGITNSITDILTLVTTHFRFKLKLRHELVSNGKTENWILEWSPAHLLHPPDTWLRKPISEIKPMKNIICIVGH